MFIVGYQYSIATLKRPSDKLRTGSGIPAPELKAFGSLSNKTLIAVPVVMS